MKWFYNMNISKKLIMGFAVVVIILVFVSYQGITNLREIDSSYAEMYNDNAVPLKYVEAAAVAFQRSRVNLLEAILDSKDRNSYIEKTKSYDEVVSNNLNIFKDMIALDDEIADYNKLITDLDKFYKLREPVISYTMANQSDLAMEKLRGEMSTLVVDINDTFDNIYKDNIDAAAQKIDINTNTSNTTVLEMLIISGIGAILALIIGLFISSIISKPVRKMTTAAQKLAVGDINIVVDTNTRDEIGKLGEAFRNMVDGIKEQVKAAEQIAAGNLDVEVNIKSDEDVLSKSLSQIVDSLNNVMADINSAADQVASGSKQVSQSSTALSQGSTEQASSIEEITASIEEIAAQTKQNASSASQANEIAEASKVNAMVGNQQMKEMLDSMRDINDASSNISKIIKVIDEIAFQTNLLALNAAVEAARAGQHGKGFAVVAEEVRNLAARSANAAKETTDLIEGSVQKVEKGTKIANDTAEALAKIVDGVTKANDLVSQIAAASNEQATAVTQITQAISQVSQVTQMNTATAEESASASEELSSQAQLLKEMIGKFNLRKQNNTNSRYQALDSKTMSMIEELIRKGSLFGKVNEPNESTKHPEAAATATDSKIKIALDDKDFGKY